METMRFGDWTLDVLMEGYPGKTAGHGGLGWSTVALLRGHGRVAVLDTGGFGARRRLVEALAGLGVRPADVTDLLLSHLHYDHAMNWPLFPSACIAVGATELDWALSLPEDDLLVPAPYVRPLPDRPGLRRLAEGGEALPGVTAHLAPGHTPGHLMFLLDGGARDLLLVQDAAKYRAELVSGRTDMTMDAAASAATIARIRELWARKSGSVMLPGHDLPMVLEDGRPVRLGRRGAGIVALFGEDVGDRTAFPLAEPGS